MLLTVPDVAAILRVSPATVRGYLRGGLPHVRLGRVYRVRQSDLDEWLAARVYTHPQGRGPRRRVDTRRASDPPAPLRIVGA